MKQFETKEALFEHLRTNKDILRAEKMAAVKQADVIAYSFAPDTANPDAVKAELGIDANGNLKDITVTAVINTTNLYDSHMDVHIPGLWKKSLSEIKTVYLLKEHKISFDNVISDRVQAATRTMDWAKLGYPQYDGKTQALVFTASISPDDPTGMYQRYKAGKVLNHSVGMRYIKLELCINSEDPRDRVEKDAWDRYISQVVNPEGIEFFWAVTEAKLIEGSAVLFGSNPATPTIGIKADAEHDTTEDISTEEPTGVTPTPEPPVKALERDNIFTRNAKLIN